MASLQMQCSHPVPWLLQGNSAQPAVLTMLNGVCPCHHDCHVASTHDLAVAIMSQCHLTLPYAMSSCTVVSAVSPGAPMAPLDHHVNMAHNPAVGTTPP